MSRDLSTDDMDRAHREVARRDAELSDIRAWLARAVTTQEGYVAEYAAKDDDVSRSLWLARMVALGELRFMRAFFDGRTGDRYAPDGER